MAMFYADVAVAGGASVPLDPDYEERAIYTVLRISDRGAVNCSIHGCYVNNS